MHAAFKAELRFDVRREAIGARPILSRNARSIEARAIVGCAVVNVSRAGSGRLVRGRRITLDEVHLAVAVVIKVVMRAIIQSHLCQYWNHFAVVSTDCGEAKSRMQRLRAPAETGPGVRLCGAIN